MFNEKVMCLFDKDYEQLNKEGARRKIYRFNGLSHKKDQRMIAEIIYKDAYDAGQNDARQNCPLREHPVDDYSLYDVDKDKTYHFELTDAQARVFKWLDEHDFLAGAEFSDRIINFEEVGRI